MSAALVPATLPRSQVSRSLLGTWPSRAVVSAGAAIVPFALGTVVLLGWALASASLEAVFSGTNPVRPNAATGMVLLGAAALLSLGGQNRPWLARAAVILCGLEGLLAGLTLVEYAAGANFGIDTLLFRPPPDTTGPFPARMSLAAAVGLLLLAVGGAVSIVRLNARVTILLGLGAAVVGWVAVLGNLYGADELTGWGAGTAIALPTAIAITALGAALLASPRAHGVHDVLGRHSTGGTATRGLVFASLVIVPIIGWLAERGQTAGLYGLGFDTAFLVAITVACLVIVAITLGRQLDLADSVRRAAENQFLRVIELSDDAICVVGPDGYFRDLNPTWTRLLGYGIDELTAHPFIDFVHPDDRAQTLAEWAAILSEGKVTADFVNRYRRQDGTYLPIEWSARISPETGAVYGVARDATTRIEREREQSLLAAIIGSTDVAIKSMDLEGRILSWNPGATRLFGFTDEEILGGDLRRLIPPEGRDETTTRMGQLAAGETLRDVETVRLAKDGRRIPVVVSESPLRDAKGVLIGATVIARDITEIVAARDRVAAVNAQLTARNAELRDFASVVSHDLRAPLRRLQIFAEMAADTPGSNADVTDLLGRIRSSADHMETLIVDLLTYARLGASSEGMRPVDLDTVVAEVLDEMGPSLVGSHAILRVGELPTVEGDRTLLRQLFANLLGNAVKFRKPDVAPVISIEADPPASVGALVEIRVGDNGIGFDPLFTDRLFRMFERLPTDTPGNGIGLAICRKITELHHGTIGAASTPGNGATFTIRLPIQQPKEQP